MVEWPSEGLIATKIAALGKSEKVGALCMSDK
jgi:hypothetical protein